MTEEEFVEHVVAALPETATTAAIEGAKRAAAIFYDPALQDDDCKQLYIAAQKFSVLGSQHYALAEGLFLRGRKCKAS